MDNQKKLNSQTVQSELIDWAFSEYLINYLNLSQEEEKDIVEGSADFVCKKETMQQNWLKSRYSDGEVIRVLLRIAHTTNPGSDEAKRQTLKSIQCLSDKEPLDFNGGLRLSLASKGSQLESQFHLSNVLTPINTRDKKTVPLFGLRPAQTLTGDDAQRIAGYLLEFFFSRGPSIAGDKETTTFKFRTGSASSLRRGVGTVELKERLAKALLAGNCSIVVGTRAFVVERDGVRLFWKREA